MIEIHMISTTFVVLFSSSPYTQLEVTDSELLTLLRDLTKWREAITWPASSTCNDQ